jgi:hypothetical protein
MRIARPLPLALALLCAISSSSRAQIVGANADSIPNAGWVVLYFSRFDRVAGAAGLAPLRETVLPAGEREIRVWTQIEIAEPRHFYRFVERRGRVTGELVDYWRNEPSDTLGGETRHDRMLYWLRGRCAEFGASQADEACRVRFVREPAWMRVLRETERLGLWTLPDPSVLRGPKWIGVDGWTMVVELRDGPRYRTYRYRNPGFHEEWPSATQASRIARTLGSIDSLARLPDVFRVFRGVTSGRYHSAFKGCDGSGPWEFNDDLRSLLKRGTAELRAAAPLDASDSTSSDSTMYEVEVFGALSPETSTRESALSRRLEVSELRDVRLATSGGCTSTGRR